MPSMTRRLRPQPDDRLAFFQGFLKRPKEVGSIIPSSRFLERRVTRTAGLADANFAIELGPGTGGTTRSFLRAMKPDAKLLAIEINPRFVRVLRRTPDPRLLVHQGSATDLRGILDEHDLPAPDAILSGIPFSTMAHPTRRATLEAARRVLDPGGRFLAYQFRDHVRRFADPVFGPGVTHREFFNLPPMRIYVWQRPDREAGGQIA